MSTPLPPAGWYPDPTSSARQRWWDGSGWTEFFQPSPPLPFERTGEAGIAAAASTAAIAGAAPADAATVSAATVSAATADAATADASIADAAPADLAPPTVPGLTAPVAAAATATAAAAAATAATAAQPFSPGPAPSASWPPAGVGATHRPRRAWRPTISTWIVGAIAILCGVIALPTSGFGGFVLLVSLFVVGGGLWTLGTGRPGWLNLARTRKAGGAATGLAVAALLLGTLLVPHPPAEPSAAPLGVASQLGSGAVSSAPGVATGTAAPRTPTPTPTPVVTVTSVDVTEDLPFGQTSYEEPTLEAGATVVVTAGVPGTKVSTWQVTLVDGTETGRTLLSETVTVAPVDEVTAIGTAQAAPPPPPAAADPVEAAPAGDGCDPNYSGACVPIASDVDCAGVSGDGPAYVEGPVYVVGGDPYGLDRDGDGIACD